VAPPKSSKAAPTALAIALESESLPALYEAWLALRLERASARAALTREQEQLTRKADYLLKTVAAARDLPAAPGPKATSGKGRGLVQVDPLAAFHAEAQKELDAAGKALRQRAVREEKSARAQDARVRKALLQRADAHLAIHKPRLAVTAHPVGSTQVMLELARFGDEDAVLLTRLLHGRLPTRWGFFADDTTEDLARGPARFYADEGVTALHPADADAEDSVLHGAGDFLPVRGLIPFSVPGKPWPRFRLVHHGPIAQVEARRVGAGYAQLMPREDGELFTGHLLRLKLAGKLELTLAVD
jgi:hypothetical protein